jgi:hypothetical protein
MLTYSDVCVITDVSEEPASSSGSSSSTGPAGGGGEGRGGGKNKRLPVGLGWVVWGEARVRALASVGMALGL